MTPASLTGLWRREFLQTASGPKDVTTWVAWLQGRRYYCDLRQPVDLPDIVTARCLADLADDELAALAGQQGFAGELAVDGNIASWQRQIDFQPPNGLADRAAVVLNGDVLVETGMEQQYVERWVQDEGAISGFGMRLMDASTGCDAVLVHNEPWLMFARARNCSLEPGLTLGTLLAHDQSRDRIIDLLDCEISFGTIDARGHWRIVRSTLPHKTRRTWHIDLSNVSSGRITMQDVDRRGAPITRCWRISARD